MADDARQRAAGRDGGDTDLELAARARERSSATTADRRELRMEALVAATFVLAAALAFLGLEGGTADAARFAGLTLICALLVRVEFEVGEGCTRPVQLVLAPMLVLLPAGAVPLAVGVAHVAAQLPGVIGGTSRPRRLLFATADSWFALAPALIVGLVGLPSGWGASVALVVAATVAQFTVDFAVSAARACLGAGERLHALLLPFAWVWLVDLLLIPIGVLAAVVGAAAPLAVGGVLPLAALLAVFARERTGRIDNAVALQRVAQDARNRLQSIVQNASDLIAIVRPDGTIATLTGSVETVFGPDWEAAEGQPLLDHVHPDDVVRVHAFLHSVLGRPRGESDEAEWRMRYPDGSWRHVSALATNLVSDPTVEGLVVTARDVHARKQFEQQLRHRAFHDPLTALANRALFYDRIEHALAREGRDETRIAVLYLDLDDFKPINDRSGHAAGDSLLVDVAERLRSCTRSSDTVARLGGDEFGVLLEAVAGRHEAVQAAERLLAALGAPFTVAGDTVGVSVSVGVAVSDGRGGGVDELLRRADLAMYAAKANGKRRMELYDTSLERADAPTAPGRAAWFQSSDEQREEIIAILEDPDAITMAFQPIVDLRTGRVAGYEALARFAATPQRPPNAWFSQAHRCGLGHELEAKALAAALAVPGRPAGAYLTLNLSPSSLTSEAVAQALPERLDGLVIEITENEVLSEDPEIRAALDDIRGRGARLAVDDTGSGYAGLTQVMRLAPDVIKLDRTIVAGVAGDPVKAALIESFVRYAREINASVCAEGIEEMADLARLADLDVAYGQGYGISRPGPPWGSLSEAASATCRISFAAMLHGRAMGGGETQDRLLEELAARLAMADSAGDLRAVLAPIARELHADAVRVATPFELLAEPATGWDAAVPQPAGTHVEQTLLGDPELPAPEAAALAAHGYRSRLRVPIQCRGAVLGTLEAYCAEERPWSRFEIRRARIIANALGGALAHVHAETHAGRVAAGA